MSTELTPAQCVGTVLGGRYRLERLLGAGGMGAVYEAQDAQGGRVAVKLLLGMVAGRRETARFAREARITSALSHPNITRIVDSGVDATSGAPYLVMELLSGQDLDARLRKGGPLAPTVAVRILLRACAGIEAAHVAGIIHRDIKPSNIFLHDGGDGEITVKVCDFGIAKQLFTDDSMSKSGNILGSPAYMSPEQATNTKAIDGRTDVWSLGMTLYEMLTGAAAFDHASSVHVMMMMLTSEDVPSIQDRARWVSEALAMVTHGALLRDVDARCPNVGALMDKLRPLTGGSDVIDVSMFGPPPLDVQSTVAARAKLPESWRSVEARVPSVPPPAHTDSATVRLLGHTLGGRYQLLGVLGHGGMGAVYETRGAEGERLAIKVIQGDALQDADRRKPGALQRFVREARHLMAITSDHVVNVIEADTDATQQVPFIVMEYLEGHDLAEHLRSSGALEVGPIVRIFTQACRGLADAHKLGIVHRDIKPANIFLHELPSGEVKAKICDFGVAKMVFAGDHEETAIDLTSTGGILGSPMYFSPEQSRNAKNVDHRTDIWSLAISLYEAISGRRPWDAGSGVVEVILAMCTQDVPSVEDAAPWISSELATVIHKGLRRDPSERYASMDEFAAALEPFAAEPVVRRTTLVPVSPERRALARTSPAGVRESTTAHASTARETVSVPPRRRSTKALVAAGILAAMVVGGGGTLALSRLNRPDRRNGEPPQAAPATLPMASTDVAASETPAMAPVESTTPALPLASTKSEPATSGRPPAGAPKPALKPATPRPEQPAPRATNWRDRRN